MALFDWHEYIEAMSKGLSNSELGELEAQLGFDLPDDLRELYGQMASGRFRYRVFVNDEGDEIGVHALIAGRARAPGEAVDLIRTSETLVVTKRLISTRDVPFARGGGGDILTLGADGRRVLFWPMDGDPEPLEAGPDLKAFARGLCDLE